MVCDRWSRLVLVLFFAAQASADVSRLMNNTNFRSHNMPNGGCNPDITSANFTTALKCQAACDALPPCVVENTCLHSQTSAQQNRMQFKVAPTMSLCPKLLMQEAYDLLMCICTDVDFCSQDVQEKLSCTLVLPEELHRQ